MLFRLVHASLSFLVAAALCITGCDAQNDPIAPDTPDTIATNQAPQARAGINQVIFAGDTAMVDGSASSDPDGDSLRFHWSLVTAPVGSAATLSDTTAVAPLLFTDSVGVYVAQLVVNDGQLNSAPSTVQVEATTLPRLTMFDRRIGSGLQFVGSAGIEVANHGGITIHVESSNPNVALVSPDATTPGASSVDIFVPDSTDEISVNVQAVHGTIGTALVTVSAPGFAGDVGSIEVVPAGLSISALATPLTVGVHDVFVVRTGAVDVTSTALESHQGMSASNLPPLQLTISSSNTGAALLAFADDTSGTLVLPMTAGEFQPNPTFLAVGSGTTTIDATIPGFTTFGTTDVEVTAPLITPFARTIGAGLQFTGTGALGIPDHGGVTVRMTSGDPSKVLLAPDGNSPGMAFVDVFVPDGEDQFTFTAQAVRDARGEAMIVGAAPGFDSEVRTITVVEPAILITGVGTPKSVGQFDAFTVLVGIANNNGGLNSIQGASAANVPPLQLTVASTDGSVAHVSFAPDTAATVTFDLAAGMFQPTVRWHALAEGFAFITASVPGFITAGDSAAVSVVP